MDLFSICLNYVASNIQLVESLVEFPETIGKLIFQESAIKGQFLNLKSSKTTRSNLKLFFDAYSKNGILTSLGLQQCHLFINDAPLACPWLLHNLIRLDLSFCGLGDDHELLPQIYSIQSLQVLNLQSNCLSDVGLRQLTTPLRFRGLKHGLLHINLSSNDITSRGLRFLKSFNRLCTIDASDTSIDEQVASLELESSLSPHGSCPCNADIHLISTEGWAKEVLESWKQEYLVTRSNTLSSLSSSSSSFIHQKFGVMEPNSFYRKRRPLPEESPPPCSKKGEAKEKLILVTKHFSCSRNRNSCTSVRPTSFLLKNPDNQFDRPVAPKNETTAALHKITSIAQCPLSLNDSRDQHSERRLTPKTNRLYKRNYCDDAGEKKGTESAIVDRALNENSYLTRKRTNVSVSCSGSGTDSGDILELYAHYAKSGDKNKTNSSGKRKRGCLEQLQDWT